MDPLLLTLCLLLVITYLAILSAPTRKDRPKKSLLWAGTQAGGQLHPPKYAGDAGYDLSITEPAVLPPGELVRVPCGIRVALPDGVSALVIPRSSTAASCILVFNTLIDSGYRGPLFVFCYNLTKAPIQLAAGDRIAQLLPILNTDLVPQVVSEEQLPASARGSNGFGSTGGAANGHSTT